MTYSVLVYPNITYARDLEKDSYVVVLRNLIEQLALIRDDIEWTILSPAPIRSLEFPNTEQIPIQLPTYPNTMRTHFDATSLLKVLNWKNWSYDAVFSHLPEHTLALKNLIHNKTNERPEFVGYTHWTEFPEITGYSMTMMDVNILGLLEMQRCGINTQAQKDLLLRNAATRFNDSTVIPLKRSRVALVTADNLGKDATRGPRGSSVKVDKPDAVLALSRAKDAVQLHALHRRTAAYPERQSFSVIGLDGSHPISYRHAGQVWLDGAAELAAVLDELELPLDAGRPTIRKALRMARDASPDSDKYRASDDLIRSACAYRRSAR